MPLEMNPEIRAQWCAALRSGDYAQTTEALRRLPGQNTDNHPEGYCCLGVLTDLYIQTAGSEMVDDYDSADPDAPPISVWNEVEGLLVRPVMEWAGLGSADPQFRPGLGGNATHMNDSGRSFAEIADLIDGGAS